MKRVIVLNKKEGETPLEALESFRAKNPKYENVPMTYAGRLDPLASGLLVVLAGDLVHQKEKYLKLKKEYSFTVLFGFSTDTYDILGKVIPSDFPRQGLGEIELEKKIKKNLKFFRGKFKQKYPIYSSRTVKGRPLFDYARKGELVESPEREVQVFGLKYLGMKKISSRKLLADIEKRINKVKGDFRQKEILKLWRKKLNDESGSFYAADFYLKCSSGTYVRTITNDLGQKIGIPSLALAIKRTQIGRWKTTKK